MMGKRRSERWLVDAVDEFAEWLASQDSQTQEKVVALRALLQMHGPALGRPYVDRIATSRRHNLKELRPSSSPTEAVRILFYFDPTRRAVLLVGGDKASDWRGWYERNIPIAEQRIERHEASLTRARKSTGRRRGPRRKS